MTSRPNPFTKRYDLMKHLIDFGTLAENGLDPTLAELIKIRASQINGCGACLIMHTQAARGMGETEERIYLLDAWHESPLFSDRERAVLAWTEALTGLDKAASTEAAYAALENHFDEDEQVKITALIGAINAFNRVNVGLHVTFPSTVKRQAA